MAGKQEDALFATTWVHLFEEDGDQGAVYRPEDADIPLSRRPREHIELKPNGIARVLNAGPTDRHIAREAKWRRDGDEIVIVPSDGGASLRIIACSPSRLLVRREPHGV